MSMSSTFRPPSTNRWLQLLLGVISMMLIANLQYGWTLFVKPIQAAHGWSIADIQWAFSIFIALETWLTPAGGWMVDSLGRQARPEIHHRHRRRDGRARLGAQLRIAEQLDLALSRRDRCPASARGFIYATCVGSAVKWFPDRRGLAVGLTAAGFGAGAALTVVPIKAMIESSGYAHTFLVFGLGQGALLFVLAWFLRYPEQGEVPAAPSKNGAAVVREFRTAPGVGEPGILAAVSNVGPGLGERVDGDGAARADRVGFRHRQGRAARRAYRAERGAHRGQPGQWRGAAVLRLGVRPDRAREHDGDRVLARRHRLSACSARWGTSPWLFVLFAGLIFFTWGEIFSLFPSTCTDVFGPKYATTNTSPALYRQGDVGAAGAARQRHQDPRPEAGTTCSLPLPS